MPGDAYGHLSNSYGRNHFEVDRPFQTILRYFTGKVPEFSGLGSFVGKELYEIADYVDKTAHPKHVMWSVNGERVDEVWLAPSERDALKRLFKEFRVNAPPYRGGSWFDHFASIYLISDPGIACILTVTNQTAYALFKYGSAEQKKLVPGLIGEAEEVTFGATWFTELQGGSDLGANTASAVEKDGAWLIEGDTKYFASDAGLADFALVTARPDGGPPGVKGLGLFLVPRLDSKGRRNFLVRRLKDKSATVSVPTGEVEFHGSEASLIGDLRKGIYYTMEDLMVSRLANSFGALGVARKAYLEAYYYAKRRNAFGKPLVDHPLVKRDLLEMELHVEGTMALAFKAVDQFQRSWEQTPPYEASYHYARLLTHVAKNATADMAAQVTKMAMELHGGLGFLEEFPVERLHREALITPIWEGPSNIQALDMLEVIAKKNAHVPMLEDMARLRDEITVEGDAASAALDAITEALARLSSADGEGAEFLSKDMLSAIGNGVATILLLSLATRAGSSRFATAGRLYARRFVQGEPLPPESLTEASRIYAVDE